MIGVNYLYAAGSWRLQINSRLVNSANVPHKQQIYTHYIFILSDFMKTAYLLHNPNAGDGGDSDDLQALIEQAGYHCQQCELEDDAWKSMPASAGFSVLAGGDGTVRKVAETLLRQAEVYDPLLVVLPMGTANNIFKSLHEVMPQAGAVSPQSPQQELAALKDVIADWEHAKPAKFDAGWLHGLGVPRFFIESTGFGLFPALVKGMQAVDDALADEPDQRIAAALTMLLEMIASFPVQHYQLQLDGEVLHTSLLSLEIMNISALGPNLQLAPQADPSDGLFDVVLIAEQDRERFAAYVQNKLDGQHEPFPFTVRKAATVHIQTAEQAFHIDDELVEIAVNTELQAHVEAGRFTFLA